MVIDKARLSQTNQVNLDEKANLRSLQLQQNYIESGIAKCDALNKILETNTNELAQKMAVLVDYEKKTIFNEAEFNSQLRDYFLTEIQYLLVSEDIDKTCAKDNVKVVYFYDESSQDTQGQILDYLKKLFGGRILVFSFNSQFTEEPMIQILLTSYGIKQFPSVVVDDEVFQGHTSVENLMRTLCTDFSKMNVTQKECRIFEK